MVNQPGLNLLLANPTYAALVRAQRAQQAAVMGKAVMATPSPFAGMFGAFNPGALQISLQQAQRGGNMDVLEMDPYMPVEMRGSGYKYAAIGGQFGFVNFRAPADTSFISAPLEASLATLKGMLAQKGATLDGTVDTRVNGLVADLRHAEQQVIEERDRINTFNREIMSGNINVNRGQSMNHQNIVNTVDSYNKAQERRNKLENKFFKVVIAMGNQVRVL
jgi:hypothetical protein